MKIIALTFCLLVNAFAAGSVGKTRTQFSNYEDKKTNFSDNKIPVAKPSEIITELWNKKYANPKMTAKELADYGNEIIDKSGFDFTFDWIPKGEENEKLFSKLDGKTFLPFFYEFTDLKAQKQPLHLMNAEFGHPCFNVIDLPVTKITGKTMTIVTDAGKIEVQRATDIETDSMVLLDKDLKKVIRIWQTPYDATPVGISADGKKIYFESHEFYRDSTSNGKEEKLNIAVEVSEDGSLRFVDVKEIKSVEQGEKNHQTEDTRTTEYKIGNKVYAVKSSTVCT